MIVVYRFNISLKISKKKKLIYSIFYILIIVGSSSGQFRDEGVSKLKKFFI